MAASDIRQRVTTQLRNTGGSFAPYAQLYLPPQCLLKPGLMHRRNSLQSGYYPTESGLVARILALMGKGYQMLELSTPAEIEVFLGDKLRALRLDKNIEQRTLAERAGISVNALKNLEGGKGSTVRTLVSVVRALKRESWFTTIAPVATVNPLTITRTLTPRVRARRKVSKNAAR